MGAPVELPVGAVLDTPISHRHDLAGVGDDVTFRALQHLAGVGGPTVVIRTAGERIGPAKRFGRRRRGVMGEGRQGKKRKDPGSRQGTQKSARRWNGSGRTLGGSRHRRFLSNERLFQAHPCGKRVLPCTGSCRRPCPDPRRPVLAEVVERWQSPRMGRYDAECRGSTGRRATTAGSRSIKRYRAKRRRNSLPPPDVQDQSMSATGSPDPPSMRCESEASMKSSRSPSSTSDGLVDSTPVRRSFTS